MTRALFVLCLIVTLVTCTLFCDCLSLIVTQSDLRNVRFMLTGTLVSGMHRRAYEGGGGGGG